MSGAMAPTHSKMAISKGTPAKTADIKCKREYLAKILMRVRCLVPNSMVSLRELKSVMVSVNSLRKDVLVLLAGAEEGGAEDRGALVP